MIPVLLYHQIAQVPGSRDPRGLAVSPEMFQKQMIYLHRAGYRSLSLEEAMKYFREDLPQPRKFVVITFDDGFRDLHSTVWPILGRLDFTGTVFFVSGFAGRKSDWDGQRGTHAVQLLSWAEARELAQAGFTFGSHTITHPRLMELDDKKARHEIRNSKVIIEDRLGSEVNLFSYPYSNFDSRIQGIVAESGYIGACGGDRGNWGPFNLWRAECVGSDSILSFALKASGFYNRLIWVREQSPAGPCLRKGVRGFKHFSRKIASKSHGDTAARHDD